MEPVDPVGDRQIVDGGGALAGVDWAAHQRHRVGRVRIPVCLHHGDCRQHRHGGLTDRHHVRLSAQPVQHRDDVVDIVVEIETAVRQRHLTGVDPVGDVDLMGRQENFHRTAQQGRVVAGQGATISSLGSLRGFSRLRRKRISRQNGRCQTTSSCTGTCTPLTWTESRPKDGFP